MNMPLYLRFFFLSYKLVPGSGRSNEGEETPHPQVGEILDPLLFRILYCKQKQLRQSQTLKKTIVFEITTQQAYSGKKRRCKRNNPQQ